MAGKRSSSLISNGILLGASIVVTALLFGTLEGVLRLAGLGEPDASRTSRLKYQQIYFPTLIPDARPDGTEVLRTDDKRLPFQEILREKPANGYRVFTFGGSATAGLGYAPTVSFAHHLRQMLEAALPESHVEVVNLGIVALDTVLVRLLLPVPPLAFEAKLFRPEGRRMVKRLKKLRAKIRKTTPKARFSGQSCAKRMMISPTRSPTTLKQTMIPSP